MAYDLLAPQPIQLPRRMTQDETQEDYDTAVSQNEEAINQNFTEQGNAIRDLLARLAVLEEG